METYEQMIVARRADGTVEAAGWDCDATRVDAAEWLERGLSLELVAADRIESLPDEADIFSTTAAIGVVLSYAQAELLVSPSTAVH